MKVYYADHFVLPLPPGHRFPMGKYSRLRGRLLAELPEVTLLPAPRATNPQLALVHAPVYISAVGDGALSAAAVREIGFPWSESMAERARRSVGASIAAMRSGLREGVAANLAGGTHHAYRDKGSGFCVFNDVAVAARRSQALWIRSHRSPLQVAVVDLDVHQGNGTAHIFQHDPSVFTLSIHGAKNFPFRKERGDLDVALPDGCEDAPYLAALDQALQEIERRFRPDVVVYLAGADPFEGDRLGRLKLSFEGLRRRDERVFAWCWARRIPLTLVMGGGYGERIDDTVEIQFNTYQVALRYWRLWQQRSVVEPSQCRLTSS